MLAHHAQDQLHLWENKWRRARIVFYIKWPNLGRDEIAARTGPKWIAVFAFNTILSLFFDWLLHIFCLCLFRVRALQMSFARGSCLWSPEALPKAALSAALVTRDLWCTHWGSAALLSCWLCLGGSSVQPRGIHPPHSVTEQLWAKSLSVQVQENLMQTS